jgi:integrase
LSNLDLSVRDRTEVNFINAIKSPASKYVYSNSLRRYLNHLKIKDVNNLLTHSSNPRLIESQIIDYIMTLRNDGLAYATVQFLLAPVLTFYQLNDVLLNRRKITRYLREYKRVVKDRAYTTEEISKALQTADERMRLVILLLCTGARIGSLPSLVLGNLTKLDMGMYKIVIYEDTNNEYYTFATPELGQAIDNYLAYRIRSNERISFNEVMQKWEPGDAPLIRQQFDITDILQARNPKPMKLNSLRKLLTYHLIKTGLRTVEHPIEGRSAKRIRKSVPLGNGFRKWTISNFVRASLNHEVRQMLCDHKGGYLDESYLRLSEEEVKSEFMKAVDFLTISAENKLRREVETLRVQKTEMEELKAEIDKVKALLGRG